MTNVTSTTTPTTLKTETCNTLSGKSSLQYALGTTADGRVLFRIVDNDGGGHFSEEWVGLDDIQAGRKDVEPVTALPLRSLYKGNSVNTPGFLLAVLLQEGLLERLPEKQKHFQLRDPEPFLERVRTLRGGKAKPKSPAKPKKAPRKRKKVPEKRTVG